MYEAKVMTLPLDRDITSINIELDGGIPLEVGTYVQDVAIYIGQGKYNKGYEKSLPDYVIKGFLINPNYHSHPTFIIDPNNGKDFLYITGVDKKDTNKERFYFEHTKWRSYYEESQGKYGYIFQVPSNIECIINKITNHESQSVHQGV